MQNTNLTQSERERFIELEKCIKSGARSFIDVGLALAEIRERKLYRSGYKTFSDYCHEKWKWTRAYCYYLINGALVTKQLPETMSTMVDNPRKARALSNVEPENRHKVIEIASAKAESEDRQMTARDIKEAGQNLSGSRTKPVRDQTSLSDPEPDSPKILTAEEENLVLVGEARQALEQWSQTYQAAIVYCNCMGMVETLRARLV